MIFDHARQRRADLPQCRQLLIRKAARLSGSPARCVHPYHHPRRAAAWRDVIRDALGTELLDNRKTLACGIIGASPTSSPCCNTMISRLARKSGIRESGNRPSCDLDPRHRLPDEIAGRKRRWASEQEHQRHSGRPAATIRSQVSAMKLAGLAADLPPSISQSISFWSSGTFITPVFAAQVQRVKTTSTPDVDAGQPTCPRCRSR